MYPLAVEILAAAKRIAGGRLWALKTWQLCGAVIGCLSLFFSILAFWTSLDSSRYARWTAQKDFALLCMDDSTRHLSIDCPKFANYSLPAPPAIKTRDVPDDGPSWENQTDVLPFGPVRPVYDPYGGRQLPDIFETDSCTSWTLQMPALFPFAGSAFSPGLPKDLNFELACASTEPPLKMITGPPTNSSRPEMEAEDPYLGKMQCRAHTFFWVTAVGFLLLLYLHSRLCTNESVDDVITARLAALLSGLSELDIVRQTYRAAGLTLLLPPLWQPIISYRRSNPPSTICTLRCRLQIAFMRLHDDLMVPMSSWGSWVTIPITDAEIYFQEVLYFYLFPALGVFLTWPVDELMLDTAWSPVPFLFLMLLYNRVSADMIDEWRETQYWRDVGREKRLGDTAQDDGGPGRTIDYCARCERNNSGLLRWEPIKE
ncbi:hypothetical protein QBC37DRAFT_454299 [Rhypophila decipiens]|uniref:Uncharacterized protein n=1 Tax=Rhypophila decipiens TaxID=261697 RepID=A0AAN7B2H4_9PEZI|nr:hypothetical protein QBC37DRAFT_454299 [Rhypophila decipiens]